MAESLTVRDRFIIKLQEKLTELTDPSGKAIFNRVFRGDLDDVSLEALPACAIEEGDEVLHSLMWPLVEKELPVFFHFKFLPQPPIEPLTIFNYYLGQLQKVVLADRSLDNLITDVNETGNSPRIEGFVDPQPGGVLLTQYKYRHWKEDPYRGDDT